VTTREGMGSHVVDRTSVTQLEMLLKRFGAEGI